MTQAELARYLRRRAPQLLHDASGQEPAGIAIYTLSDPRDLRAIRYVGQTRAPRRRLLQHLATARLWLPADERPWWVTEPALRPLYGWIRELFADGGRLPEMIVESWVADVAPARVAERALIHDCLARGLSICNVESERQGRQLGLL